MRRVSDWHPPKNTYVTIEEDCCPVPEIDEGILDTVIGCSMADENDDSRLNNMVIILDWLKSMSDAEIEAGTVYFLDRWTWDSGHAMDRFFGRLFERERSRRRGLTRDLDSRKIMDILDHLADREENGDS